MARSRHDSMELVERKNIISVEPMDSADALALFVRNQAVHRVYAHSLDSHCVEKVGLVK